jgi:hypothetical protein
MAAPRSGASRQHASEAEPLGGLRRSFASHPRERAGVDALIGDIACPQDWPRPSEPQEALYGVCLYRVQKFQSDTERRFAMILQPDAIRWFKPAKDQVQIFYRIGSIPQPYVPDFVAETESDEVMIETKARNEMAAPEVMAKRQVAEEWLRQRVSTCGHVPGEALAVRAYSARHHR